MGCWSTLLAALEVPVSDDDVTTGASSNMTNLNESMVDEIGLAEIGLDLPDALATNM